MSGAPALPATQASSQQEKAPSQDLQAVFNHFDHNKDGHISHDEMRLSLGQLGIALDPADLASLLRDADADSDGFIDYREFVGLYREITGDADVDADGPAGDAEKELKEAFQIFDKDGDGLITAKELHSVLKSIGVLQGRSMADCVAMIRRVDSDGNGQVDFQEFKAMMSSEL